MVFQKPLTRACPQVVPIQVCPVSLLLKCFLLEGSLCRHQEPQQRIQLGEGEEKGDAQKFLLGPKQSHKVILYMDRLVGWMRRGCVWDPSPGLGHHGWHCASEPSRASTAQIPCVFSAGAESVISVISNPISPHFPRVVSRACQGYLGDNFISVWPLRGWTLTSLG